jgi:acetyltransferase-like isoleucine patch superfamily enzyme
MFVKYVFPKLLRKIINPCAIKNSRVDKTAKGDIGSIISNSEMGRYSYIGEHTSLLSTTVGSFTSISNYCAIGGASHTMEWASMSPVFINSRGLLKTKFAHYSYTTSTRTYIGNDVWIGSHCLIKAGVSIADGAVVGMGAVVTKDIGPYEIWAGVPAKFIRKRFDNETIQSLLKSEWWSKEKKEIKKLAIYVTDVERFIQETL